MCASDIPWLSFWIVIERILRLSFSSIILFCHFPHLFCFVGETTWEVGKVQGLSESPVGSDKNCRFFSFDLFDRFLFGVIQAKIDVDVCSQILQRGMSCQRLEKPQTPLQLLQGEFSMRSLLAIINFFLQNEHNSKVLVLIQLLHWMNLFQNSFRWSH